MKFISTIIIFFYCVALYSQYSDYQISVGTGITADLNDGGIGSGIVIDLQKHIGKGIYGSLGYNQGHWTKGNSVVSITTGIEDKFLATNMTQYKSVNLGIKKVQRLSPRDQASLTLNGMYLSKRTVTWDLSMDQLGRVDLDTSQEKHSKRSDLTFNVSLDCSHQFTNYLSLGFFLNYYNKPEHILIGLKSTVLINRKKENNSAASPSKEINKNSVEARVSYVGGDGTSQMIQYDIEYGRGIWKFLSLYFKISTGQKHSADYFYNINRLSEDQLATLESVFSADDNEAGPIWQMPAQSTSIGFGIKARTNSDGNSALSFAAGILYYNANIVRSRGRGSQVSDWQEDFDGYREIIPEFAAYYDYNINEHVYIGTKASLALGRFLIGVGIHGGIRF